MTSSLGRNFFSFRFLMFFSWRSGHLYEDYRSFPHLKLDSTYESRSRAYPQKEEVFITEYQDFAYRISRPSKPGLFLFKVRCSSSTEHDPSWVKQVFFRHFGCSIKYPNHCGCICSHQIYLFRKSSLIRHVFFSYLFSTFRIPDQVFEPLQPKLFWKFFFST